MRSRDLGASLSHLPAAVRMHVEQLRQALVAELGDALVSIVLHGSTPRGDYEAQRSDVDLLVVLARDDRKTLAALGPILEVASAAARVECVFFRADELAHSADVFPLLFDDVKRCHAVLHGADPFAQLVVSPLHRCLRIEQELRDARVRLRRIVVEHATQPEVLTAALTRKLRQLRSPLAGLLRERGEPPRTEDMRDVLEGAARAWGTDLAPLAHTARDPLAALDTLAALLDAAIADVDARGKAHAEAA